MKVNSWATEKVSTIALSESLFPPEDLVRCSNIYSDAQALNTVGRSKHFKEHALRKTRTYSFCDTECLAVVPDQKKKTIDD
jgi:hypothetical protein